MKFSKKFISATHKYTTFFEHVSAPLLRKSFEITKPLSSASLTICGLGFYKLYINGKEITKGLIAPYISNPDHIIYYDEYNIAPLLKTGKNTIGVILGNGMQNAPGGTVWDFDQAQWRSSPKLALNLEAAFINGEVFELEADESFRVSESPIWFDELRCGVFYNALKEQDGWSEPDFDDREWGYAHFCEMPRGEARLCEAEPVCASERISPVKITKGALKDYETFDKVWASLEIPETTQGFIYDFGVNSAGVFEFKINNAKPGQRIEFFSGETLDENGDLYIDNFGINFPKYYGQRDIYICKGGKESFVPDFTYHGFRYCLVIGLDENQATTDALTYITAHTKLKEMGGFSCSDETANRLQAITRRSDLANLFYFPTDCPQREKNGWTADAALSAEHMLLNLSVEKSYLEWLRNIRKAQNEKGALPGIVPTPGWGYHWGNGPAWDSVLTYLPFFTYQYRGERKIIEENAASILRYINYLSDNKNKDGLIEIGLCDWLHPGRAPEDPKCPLIVTDSIISMSICAMAAFMFDEINKPVQRDFALSLYNDFKAAIRTNLVDFYKMTLLGDTQTGLALAIYYGIFEKSEIPLAVKRLVKLIDENNGLLDTGCIGGRYIFHVLSDNGYAELAYSMIEGPDYPSYGFWLNKGATSLWESFTLGHIDSLNHHFWGDISAWYIKAVAGIRINPSFNDVSRVDIRPNFISKLSFAQAWHNSINGKVSVRWDKADDKVTIKVNIPQGSSGRLYLPDGWVTAAGEYPHDSVDFINLKAETVVEAVRK